MSSWIYRIWYAFDGVAKDTIWAGLYDFFSLFTVLFSFLVLQKILSPQEYGSYIAVFAVLSPIGALSFAGVGLASLKAIIREKVDLDVTFESYFSLGLIQGIVSIFISFLVVSLIVADLSKMEVLFLIISELLGTATIFLMATFVQASSGFFKMSIVRIVGIFIKFLLIFFLALFDERLKGFLFFGRLNLNSISSEPLTILNLGIGYSILYIAFALVLYFYFLPICGYHPRIGIPSRDSVKFSYIFGLPMAAGQLQTQGDKVALKAFGYSDQTGFYGAAYRFVLLGLAPLRVLNSAAFHRFLPENIERKGFHLNRCIKFGSFMFIFSIFLVLAIYFTLPYSDFLLDDKFEESKKMIPWLLCFIPLIALSGTPLNALIGLGRSKERSYIYVFSSIFTTVMYILLIPSLGWKGAVIATLAGEAFLAIFAWISIFYFQRLSDKHVEDNG